jgi:hypothetical protein
MVTRRTFYLIIGVTALSRPVLGAMRLWGVKTMSATTPGTFMHTTAEVVTILT